MSLLTNDRVFDDPTFIEAFDTNLKKAQEEGTLSELNPNFEAKIFVESFHTLSLPYKGGARDFIFNCAHHQAINRSFRTPDFSKQLPETEKIAEIYEKCIAEHGTRV